MTDRYEERRAFLHKLQLEYLTQRLRSFIYKDEKYIHIAAGIAEKKKEKIISLGQKFGIETIFSGIPIQDFVKEYFWNSRGLPNFSYKDEDQKGVQWNYDAWYILFRGTIVICDGRLYTVLKNNPHEEKVELMGGGCRIEKSYADIQLIDKFQWV